MPRPHEAYRRKVPSLADSFGQPPSLDQLSPENPQRGDIYFWDGVSFRALRAGAEGEVLNMTNGIPNWQTLAEAGIADTDHSADHEDGGADEITIAGLAGIPTELQTHLDDAADAHDASAISILDTAGDFTATDVEGALAELQSDAEGHVAAADPHTGYVLESLVDAKGDIIAATAADAVARLAVGANDTVLTADSAQATGLKWAAGSSVAALDDLTDVTITTATLADRLRYDGSVWRNSAKYYEPVTDGDATAPELIFAGGDVLMAEVT